MAHNRGKLSEVNTSKYAREKSFDITFNQKEYNNYINCQTTKYGALANMNKQVFSFEKHDQSGSSNTNNNLNNSMCKERPIIPILDLSIINGANDIYDSDQYTDTLPPSDFSKPSKSHHSSKALKTKSHLNEANIPEVSMHKNHPISSFINQNGKQAEKPIIVSKELQRKTNNSNGRNNALGSKKSTLSKL